MSEKKSQKNHDNSTATLTIQWLSYAFWGWLAVSLAWLSAIVFSFFIDPASNVSGLGDAIIYPVSATIVLLILSIVTDLFYSKREPVKKEGSANLLMIIHTVIFSLLAAAAAITAVFSILNTLLSENSTGSTIALYTSLLVLLFLLALLFRIVSVGKVKRGREISWIAMGIIVVAMISAAIAGPITHVASTKQDRQKDLALQQISYQIDNFINIKNRLPESLSELSSVYNSDSSDVVREAIRDRWISYKQLVNESTDTTRFKYQLCTTYDKETLGWKEIDKNTNTEYSSYQLYNVNHPAGKYCYDIGV